MKNIKKNYMRNLGYRIREFKGKDHYYAKAFGLHDCKKCRTEYKKIVGGIVCLSGRDTSYDTYRTPIVILHSGYDLTLEEKKQKAKRNLVLLQKELEDLKNADEEIKKEQQPYLLYQIGKSYFLMEDYVNACAYFDQGLTFDLDERSEYVLDMVESYGYALLNGGQLEAALAFTNIYDAFSYSADFLFLMGLIYMKNAFFPEAVREFENATQKPEAKMTGINSYLAYYNIGVIYECLGNKKEALAAYEKCGEYPGAKKQISQLFSN